MAQQLKKTGRAALALLAAALAACSAVGPASAPAPQVTPSQSVAQAERRLADVARERAAIEVAYADSEQVCYTRFFVTSCLDTAKEQRRSALASLRATEVEAEHYKRKAAVDERDRALAKAEQEFQAEQARLAAEPPKAPHAAEAAPSNRPAVPSERIARHEQKLKQIEADEQANAEQRAAKVRAYEQRKLESEQRQREIEAKKAGH
jgi:colicin import membrane protein